MKVVNRFEIVGSFLRPESLKRARRQYAEGKISEQELTAAEDEAISELVARQKGAGVGFFTDGEFRRSTWHLDFMWGFDGVGHTPTKTGLPFHGEAAMIDDTFLTGRLRVQTHPFVGHYRFLKQFEEDGFCAKQTLPAPAQFYAQMVGRFSIDETRKYYPDTAELAQDIAAGYRRVIVELYAAGCRHIQLDDCTWGMFVDPNAGLYFDADDKGLERTMESFLSVNNLALEGKPDDLAVTTHICRGNYHSTYASSGAYDRVAEYVFSRENVAAYFLEYDDERSGGFAPLRYVTDGKEVVLGLVTTKRPLLEDKEAVLRRIEEAAKYLPIERLALSTQCGFASCEIGNKLTEAQQWDKLALVRQIAKEVWGE